MLQAKIYSLLMAVLSLFSLWNCAKEEKKDSVAETSAIQNISVEEAYNMLQSNPDVVVIDVRTPEEYSGPTGHIPGALLKPVQEIETWSSELMDLKDKEIMLVCRSGNRSSRAADFLKDHGFKNLLNVEGGMLAWEKKEYPVEKEDK